jgi:hypothetical protein
VPYSLQLTSAAGGSIIALGREFFAEMSVNPAYTPGRAPFSDRIVWTGDGRLNVGVFYLKGEVAARSHQELLDRLHDLEVAIRDADFVLCDTGARQYRSKLDRSGPPGYLDAGQVNRRSNRTRVVTVGLFLEKYQFEDTVTGDVIGYAP